MGQLDKAKDLLEHAVQMDPTNAAIHFRLSTVYQRLRRTDDARREVDQFHKYKDLKDKLRDTYRELHLDPGKFDVDESSAHP